MEAVLLWKKIQIIYSVLLSNDPWCGNPGVFIPLDSATLTFDYSFSEPADNVDFFFAWLFDWNIYTVLQDAHGNDLSFELANSGAGTVTWDLLGASFLGTTVGMEFQLNANMEDSYLTSVVTVSNAQTNPVPEPATLFLVGSGLIATILARKKLTS